MGYIISSESRLADGPCQRDHALHAGSFYPAAADKSYLIAWLRRLSLRAIRYYCARKVQRILIEGGRVVGVEFNNKALGNTMCLCAGGRIKCRSQTNNVEPRR